MSNGKRTCYGDEKYSFRELEFLSTYCIIFKSYFTKPGLFKSGAISNTDIDFFNLNVISSTNPD
jgi:hypothetical protein